MDTKAVYRTVEEFEMAKADLPALPHFPASKAFPRPVNVAIANGSKYVFEGWLNGVVANFSVWDGCKVARFHLFVGRESGGVRDYDKGTVTEALSFACPAPKGSSIKDFFRCGTLENSLHCFGFF